MPQQDPVSRRGFLNRSIASAGAAGVAAVTAGTMAEAAAADGKEKAPAASPANEPAKAAEKIPCGMLGKARISKLMVGGNLISGCMHCRDLKYVNALFRAYVTEEKIIETLRLAEECGINTVFETGGNFVHKYNKRYNGHMQFIPHIEVNMGQTEEKLKDHIKAQVDTGAVALYVWGVAGDAMVKAGAIDRIAKAVEFAKKYDLAVGVGGHSLRVPKACEEHKVPCDFYVKTLHRDDYPSAIPKEHRTEWIEGKGQYDNMWCTQPEETIEFMKTVTKPWVAFKVLAAGAYVPQQGFTYAFKNGADFIAVGMLDFQVRGDAELAAQLVRRYQQRERPWRA